MLRFHRLTFFAACGVGLTLPMAAQLSDELRRALEQSTPQSLPTNVQQRTALTSCRIVAVDDVGARIPGVTLDLFTPRGAISLRTDAAGEARLPWLAAGEYLVRLQVDPLRAVTQRFTVTALPQEHDVLLRTIDAAPDVLLPDPTLTRVDTIVMQVDPTPTQVDLIPPPIEPAPENELSAVYWNTWAANQADARVPIAAALAPKGRYYITFDLSAAPYAPDDALVRSKRIAPHFLGELRKIPGDTATFLVVPLILGRGLQFDPGQMRTREITVDLRQLREPNLHADPDEAFAAAIDRLSAIHEAGSVAHGVRIGVHGTGSGCAAVALTIWTPQLDRPITQIAHRVQVGSPPTPCLLDETIADTADDDPVQMLVATRSFRPAAALLVFETALQGDLPHTQVLYRTTENKVLSWTLEKPMSTFITAPEKLAATVRRARAAQKGYDFHAVSKYLTTALFPRASSSAQEALTNLRRLGATAAPDPPTYFYAVLLDVRGQAYALPLPLIDYGAERPLGAVVDVVIPLIREATVPVTQCVGDWTTLFPPDLADLGLNFTEDEIAADPILRSVFTDYAFPNRKRTRDEFEAYLQSAANPACPEGLLLIAHHDGGEIKLNPDADGIQTEELTRSYYPASTAILLACAIGDPQATAGGPVWVAKLRDQGVDAAVYSIFSIPWELGARLAVAVSAELADAAKREAPTTIRELYRRAIARVADDTTFTHNAMVYELLLTGEPTVALCGSPPTTKKEEPQSEDPDADALPHPPAPAAPPRLGSVRH